MAVKPEDDFQGYMDGIARATEEAERMQAKLEAHRIWRETTWGGWTIRQLQAVGDHFAPFFTAVANMMSNDASTGNIVVMTIVRFVIILICIGLIYVAAWIFQSLIGKEYIVEVEETIIVDDEEEEEEEEADTDGNTAESIGNNNNNKGSNKRNARDKKKKQ